jgi:glycosyltransferase involved in cell wall biosynthesis
LEALAAGKACVASKVGGISDIIRDGCNGMLVDVGDSKAISDAVLKLLADDSLRAEMGRKGRALVREKFTLDGMADNVSKVYADVV